MKTLWYPVVIKNRFIHTGHYQTGVVIMPESFSMECREWEYKALVF